MCETAKAVIQHWCGLGVESRALVLEPQALLVLPVLQPHLCSQRRELREGMTGPLRRPWDAGASRAHLQKLSDPDSQGLVSIPTAGSPSSTAGPPSSTAGPPSPLRGLHPPLRGLHPHCGASIPTVESPSSTAGPPSPLRGLHPHCGASIPHCGVSILHCGASIPTVGSLSPLWGLHSLSGVSTPHSRDPIPVPGVPHAQGFLSDPCGQLGQVWGCSVGVFCSPSSHRGFHLPLGH